MDFIFCGFQFHLEEDVLSIGFSQSPVKNVAVSSVRIAGNNILTQSSEKQTFPGSESVFRVKDYVLTESKLIVSQKNDFCEAETIFEKIADGMRVYCIIKNVSEKEISLENVCILNMTGLDGGGRENTYLYRFYNSHHCECQPRKLSLDELGLFETKHKTFRRISGCNVGSWSCKEELPQVILEDGTSHKFLMFQIESCGSWYWEIGEENSENLYLSLSGGNAFTSWGKKLKKGEEYVTRAVSLCLGESLNEVLQKMTRYRRASACFGEADSALDSIFNEYMYLSWDSPFEERTKALVPVVAKTGAKVYVIDCGWHDEVDGNKIYPYVGNWRESKTRFPHGVKAITDYIRSYGMKAGLWIEPEVCGKFSGVDYPEDAYIRRNGERICVCDRYFLDFRHRAVQKNMSDAIERMVCEYGAQYIKIDCNQDCGSGTEVLSDSYGDGLEKTTDAFWEWLNAQRKKYPDVIFESCSSGGMRMDWKSLCVSPIISTSDQVMYDWYPYIVGNIFSAVLPEQAGFWSYPIVDGKYLVPPHDPDKNEVVMNMVNSVLGRTHLASDLRKLTSESLALVKEGINYADSLRDFKRTAVPYLPFGFTRFGEKRVAVGLKNNKKLILAVWNFDGSDIIVPLSDIQFYNCGIAYPKNSDTVCMIENGTVRLSMQKNCAVILEIGLIGGRE